MGVVNVTPDSFSDGGLFLRAEDARVQVDRLLADGADLLDLGAESTRPGAAPIPAREQIGRLEPVLVHAVRERRAVVSVDTSDPEVAHFALSRGAALINDVSCLADIALAREVHAAGAALLIMHARGPMRDMAGFSHVPDDAYGDVVADVRREWEAAQSRALAVGLRSEAIWFDPGLGFMKNARHSCELVQRLDEFVGMAGAIVVGPSRKSFLAKTVVSVGVGQEPNPRARLGGTIAACLACAARGASMLRVHDVFEVRQALLIDRALRRDRA